MFVIEVRPKRTWRGLRFPKDGTIRRARVTTRHTSTSHWFHRATAEWVVAAQPEVRWSDRKLDLPTPQWRIVECGCAPRSLR